MEYLIDNVKNIYIVLLLTMLVLVVLDIIFEKEKNRKLERDLKIYELEYQKSEKNFSEFKDNMLKNLKDCKDIIEKIKEKNIENIRDLEDLKTDFKDITEKHDYWKNKAKRLQNQLNYQKRKCKNNNIK